MRLVKAIGLAAIATLVATALVGVASASATSTQLCNVHTGLTCPEGQGTAAVHMTLSEGTVGKLLSSLATVLCLNVLATATPLGLANPQSVHAEAEYTSCGTNSTHTNCKVTVEEQPLFNLLKIGLDEGSLTATNGITHLVCTEVGIFKVKVDCLYDSTGLLFKVGGQHLTAEKTPIKFIEGSFSCPENSQLDGLLETSGESSSAYTALCKEHTSSCAEENQAKSLKMSSTKAPVFYNPVANVECESSSLAATVLGPAETQKLDLTELSWKGCHTQGAADNCAVTSKGSPVLDLEGTALNVGEATTLGLEIAVECLILDLIELDCVYGGQVSLPVEGALYKIGTGNGKLTASKVVLEKLSGEGHCPESVKWDAAYEFSEHLYVVPWTVEPGRTYILQ
jgi:hypothetical protein